MDCFLIIYLFILFVLFVPKVLFKVPIKNNMIATMMHALLFVFVFQIGYSFIIKLQRENLEVEGTNTDSLVNIIKKIADNLTTVNENKHYKINNEVIQVTPDVAEEYDLIYDEDGDKTVIVPPKPNLQ
jgi:hypothetical protein